jgi:hypothetical protein
MKTLSGLSGFLFWLPLMLLFCLLNPGAAPSLPLFGAAHRRGVFRR